MCKSPENNFFHVFDQNMFTFFLLIKRDHMIKFIVSVGGIPLEGEHIMQERKEEVGIFAVTAISQPGHLTHTIFNLLVWALHGTPENLPRSFIQGVCVAQ